MSETTATKITVKEATPKTNANGAYAIIVAQDDVKYYAFPPKTASPQEKQQFLSHLAIGKTVIAHWKQNGNFKNITAIEPVQTPVQEPAPVAPEAKSSPVIPKPVQSITPDNEPRYNGKTSAEWDAKERRERESIEAQKVADLVTQKYIAGKIDANDKRVMYLYAYEINALGRVLDESAKEYIDKVLKKQKDG